MAPWEIEALLENKKMLFSSLRFQHSGFWPFVSILFYSNSFVLCFILASLVSSCHHFHNNKFHCFPLMWQPAIVKSVPKKFHNEQKYFTLLSKCKRLAFNSFKIINDLRAFTLLCCKVSKRNMALCSREQLTMFLVMSQRMQQTQFQRVVKLTCICNGKCASFIFHNSSLLSNHTIITPPHSNYVIITHSLQSVTII